MTASKGPEGTVVGRSGPFVHRVDLPADGRGSAVHVAWTSVDAGSLAFHVLDSDAPAARADVAAARRALEAEMGVTPGSTVYLDQVHSTDVVWAEGRGWEHDAPETADAAVSRDGTRPLAVMVADCLPVVLMDERTGATAVAHAGRRGLLGGVLENTHARLLSLRPAEDREAPGIRAWIGPGVCGNCYEVPPQMCADAAERIPVVASRTSWGTPALDLPAGAEAVLASLGAAVERVRACTLEDDRLFSHRRAPGRGRFAGLVWRTPADASTGEAQRG